MMIQAGHAELILGQADAGGQGINGQILERIDVDGLSHFRGRLLGQSITVDPLQERGGE